MRAALFLIVSKICCCLQAWILHSSLAVVMWTIPRFVSSCSVISPTNLTVQAGSDLRSTSRNCLTSHGLRPPPRTCFSSWWPCSPPWSRRNSGFFIDNSIMQENRKFPHWVPCSFDLNRPCLTASCSCPIGRAIISFSWVGLPFCEQGRGGRHYAPFHWSFFLTDRCRYITATATPTEPYWRLVPVVQQGRWSRQ